MPTFSFFGKAIDLPAIRLPATAPTRDSSAWQFGHYTTVRLVSPVSALRVHTDGRAYPGRDASAEAGAWILIGDVIQTSSEIARSRSLPTSKPSALTAFTRTSEAHLAPGTTLNIGLASAKFGGKGGEFQAEYVSGPPIRFSPLTGKVWHGTAGNA